jgi:DNA-binding MarR family transcriptional regulator
MNSGQPTPAESDVVVVRRAVGRLARRLRMERPEHGLSSTKLSLLSHLHQLGTMSPGELAARERARPQSLTRALAELVGEGLISRESDPNDRRQAVLAITVAGVDALARDMQQRDAWLAEAMARTLSPTERELLRLAATLMERLTDAGDRADRAHPTPV